VHYSFDADPNTACRSATAQYARASAGVVFGGPSVSSPSLAGIVHSAGGQRLNSADELTLLYSGLGSGAFRDILSGSAGIFLCRLCVLSGFF